MLHKGVEIPTFHDPPTNVLLAPFLPCLRPLFYIIALACDLRNFEDVGLALHSPPLDYPEMGTFDRTPRFFVIRKAISVLQLRKFDGGRREA